MKADIFVLVQVSVLSSKRPAIEVRMAHHRLYKEQSEKKERNAYSRIIRFLLGLFCFGVRTILGQCDFLK